MDEQRAPDPAGRAKEEAAGQLVWIAMMAVAIPLLAWLERKASDLDALRSVKMRAAKGVERFAARSAAGLWKLAERARLLYESGRG